MAGVNDPSWLDVLRICEIVDTGAITANPAVFPYQPIRGKALEVKADLIEQHELRLSALERRLIQLQVPQFTANDVELDVRAIAKRIQEMLAQESKSQNSDRKSA
jgi:hypothetical protein